MEGNPAPLIEIARVLGRAVVFLLTTASGVAILASAALLVFLLRVAASVRIASAAARAAGERLGAGGALVAVLDAAADTALRFLTVLPTLALLAAAGIGIAAAADAGAKLQALAAANERVRELSAVVRNLDRSVKVADVRALAYAGGYTSLELSFYDGARPAAPVEKRKLTLKGRDIYFDAIVLNFAYSEIESGRRVNIAVPYRVFSEEVPQSEGLYLGGVDAAGVPYAFSRADDDIYGIAPETYRARLKELMEIVRTDEGARKEGIVRSLHGAAVHRRLSPGDRLEIRLEQSGGMTVKEVFPF